jgi:hypothetical protein
MKKVYDFVALGALSPTDTPLVKMLLEIGKAPLGWGGEFDLIYLIETPDPAVLPVGISMYINENPVEELAGVISDHTVLFVLPGGSRILQGDPPFPATCAVCTLRSSSALAQAGSQFKEAREVSTAAELIELIYAVRRLTSQDRALDLL